MGVRIALLPPGLVARASQDACVYVQLVQSYTTQLDVAIALEQDEERGVDEEVLKGGVAYAIAVRKGWAGSFNNNNATTRHTAIAGSAM